MAEEVDLEDRSIQIIQFEEQREKILKTRNRYSEIHWIILSCLMYVYLEYQLIRREKMGKNIYIKI